MAMPFGIGIIIPIPKGVLMSIVRMKNKKNGVVYLYEFTSYWDKEKKQARNTRVCIGKIDPQTDKIIYNRHQTDFR